MTKPCLLFDADGVFTNFIEPCLEAIFQHTGRRFTHDDVTDWDIMKSLGIDAVATKAIYRSMEVPGLCFDMPAYPGARDGVEQLRQWANVFIVTSPFGGDHWMHERDRWMVQKMGFAYDDIMHVRSSRKHHVWGNAFVEDKTSTLQAWRSWWWGPGRHPEVVPLLFQRNYNTDDGWDGLAAPDWPALVASLEAHFLS